MTGIPQTAMQAGSFIEGEHGKRYDPKVVDAFLGATGTAAQSAERSGTGLAVRPGQLKPGMVLPCDIVTRDGVVVLSKEFMLDESLIVQIQNFEKTDGAPLTIFINPERR